MNLEDELRAALRREEPSAGFAERVVARTQPRIVAFPRKRFAWAGAAIAAGLALVFTVNVEQHRRQEEEAGRQAVLALRIASEKLNFARAKVLRPSATAAKEN